MRKPLLIVLVLGLLVAGVATWLFSRGHHTRRSSKETVPADLTVTVQPAAPGAGGTNASPLIGETILRGYAHSNSPPENDLTLMARLTDNFRLLVKADLPLSANEDWAEALRGRNPSRERFLPDEHPAFDAQGRLVDRWGTPLFFHALGRDRFEIRSAGPDRKLWTNDDLHRNPDGSFRRGPELNAPSLLESAPVPLNVRR